MSRSAFMCAALLLVSCAPEVEESGGPILEPRILAVRGIPAEARPNAEVRYETLIARPDGTIEESTKYSYCSIARSVEERTGVSRTCLNGEGLLDVAGKIPSDACALFGPNTPPTAEGEDPKRPSDPDPSGGYFIPVLAEDGEEQALPSFGFQRIRCDLAGATREIFEQYQARYRENRHPEISLMQLGGETLDEERTNVLPAGEATLRIEVRADSFEPFVVYSANDSALYDRTEEIRVYWYASAGNFDASESLVEKNSRTASVQWSGPDSGGARLWVVVIDSRGGSAWAEFDITTAQAEDDGL